MVSDDIRFVFPIIIVKRAQVVISSVVSMFGFGVIANEMRSTQLPVWAFMLSLAIRTSA